MNKIITMLVATCCALFACDNVDLSNPDNYPLQVTRSVDANGAEYTDVKQLPFDYDLYGQAQEALSVAPPNRYGIESSAAATANDTRCISGGHTSGTAYCEVAGGKHINWDFSGVDNRLDSQLKVNFRTYAIQGFTSMAQDSAPSGFVQEKENPLRTINGAIFFNPGDCPLPGGGNAIACTTDNLGPVTLAGGKRVRLLTMGNVLIRLVPEAIMGPQLSLPGMTSSQQAFNIMNVVLHEVGHSEGFGHVPTAENDVDAMTLDNGKSNQVVKHLSSTEKSQLTTWLATF